MKCPTCDASINGLDLISHRSKFINCRACGAHLRIRGRSSFAIAPLFLFLVFPGFLFSLPLFILIPINAALIAGIYFLSFLIFVKVEPAERDKPHSGNK